MPVIAIAAALAGNGCAVEGAKPAPPAVPAAFEQPSTQGPWPDADWYRGFASGELDSLITLAEHNSLDIAAAVARVKQADARARQAGAALLPQVDLNGNVTQIGGGSNGATAHELRNPP
jgi:outer membrane protein TolC